MVLKVDESIRSFASYSLMIPALLETTKKPPSKLHDIAVVPFNYGYSVILSGPIFNASFSVSCSK